MKTAHEIYKEETGSPWCRYDCDTHTFVETSAYIKWLESKVEASINEDLWKDS
jgi:hypothetical protein